VTSGLDLVSTAMVASYALLPLIALHSQVHEHPFEIVRFLG
jgi:hypothetical protein